MLRNYVFMLFVLTLFAMGLATTARAADSCQPVYDAITKIITTPNHSYSTQTAAFPKGATRSAETIYVQGKIYVMVKGKWMLSPVTPKEVMEQENENRKSDTSACQFLRNESVNGEPAAVYSLHRVTKNEKEDGQIWISRTSGLALRRDLDMDTGGGMGKSHLSARFEYTNVKPPM